MVSFPNCKINFGLHVIDKRKDGFHNIESIFFPVALHDAVEIIDSPESVKLIDYSQTGLSISGELQDNLCIKAYKLLKNDFPKIPAIKMHLHKAIPMGAGLGGGSADAVSVLKLLNTKFNLNLSGKQLIQYALTLGSDCPFFVDNKPCFATGRGEILEEIPINMTSYKMLLVNPGIHIATGWAFSQVKFRKERQSLKECISLPVAKWQETIYNDFEEPVFALYPEIAEIKSAMTESGALYTSMSGSGSTIYGIFEKKWIPSIKFPAHYFLKWV